MHNPARFVKTVGMLAPSCLKRSSVVPFYEEYGFLFAVAHCTKLFIFCILPKRIRFVHHSCEVIQAHMAWEILAGCWDGLKERETWGKFSEQRSLGLELARGQQKRPPLCRPTSPCASHRTATSDPFHSALSSSAPSCAMPDPPSLPSARAPVLPSSRQPLYQL
jgi:hypothetical protein